MWFTSRKQPPTLSEEHVQRLWDITSRVDALEAKLDERLDELYKRYQRAEQAERRLEAKRAHSPCDEDVLDAPDLRDSVYTIARRANGTA